MGTVGIRHFFQEKVDYLRKFDIFQLLNVVLLLVSADFLASDFCYDKEMEVALSRHNKGEAVVVPIIIRPVDFEESPFAKLQALPTDAKPVTIWENRDEAWLSVARGIRKVCENIANLRLDYITSPKIIDDEIEDQEDKLREEDFGIIDFQAIIIEALQTVANTQDQATERTNKLTAKFIQQTQEIQNLQLYNGSDKARRLQNLAGAVGSELLKYAKDMDFFANKIETSWVRVDQYFVKIINYLEDPSAEQRQEVEDDAMNLYTTLGDAEKAVEEAGISASELLAIVKDLGKYSAALKMGARPASKSMERFRDIYWGIKNSIGQMRRIIMDSVDRGNLKSIHG
jgi:hypothetical protein